MIRLSIKSAMIGSLYGVCYSDCRSLSCVVPDQEILIAAQFRSTGRIEVAMLGLAAEMSTILKYDHILVHDSLDEIRSVLRRSTCTVKRSSQKGFRITVVI